MPVSLKTLNTFGIAAEANNLLEFTDIDSLRSGLNTADSNHLVLGGGSNILFTKNYEGTVLLNRIKGIEVVKKDPTHLLLKVGAGENWHGLVKHCVAHNLGGIENLSLIPGTAGAAPIQNIGAYGVELKDVFQGLEAYCIEDGSIKVFSKTDCQFGYRQSIFKKEAAGKYVILNITLQLTTSAHQIRTEYGAIQTVLKEEGIINPTIADVSNAVIEIRSSKLPNPTVIGNAGSFFKNPSVHNEVLADLLAAHPKMPHYPSDVAGHSKLAAGWLIEQCGWKGYRSGDAGVHKDQALVLVNYGNVTGKEIYDLSEKIAQSVKSTFNVCIEREVNIV